MSICFVIVRTSIDILYRECYSYIRKLYPDHPILIIGDIEDTLYNTKVIRSLHHSNAYPLYYLSTSDMDVDKVVILHDTMMIREALDLSEDRMLWSVSSSPLDLELEILSLIGNDDLLLHHREKKWTPSYRGCYIISMTNIRAVCDLIPWNVIESLSVTEQSQALDGIISSALYYIGMTSPPLVGPIENHPHYPSYSIGEYVLGIRPDLPIIHIMSTTYITPSVDKYLSLSHHIPSMIGDIRTLCIFATYNPSNNMSSNTIIYINELCRYYERVIVVATGTRIYNIDDLDHRVRLYYAPNKNYDFGLWYRIVEYINIDKLDEVALINDSCHIIRSLSNTISYIRSCGERFVGITDSHEKSYHIQSYFLVFRGYAPISRMKEFFISRDMNRSRNYDDTVLDFEIALTPFITEVVEYKALYTIENIHMLRTTGSKIANKELEINQYNSAWMLWDVLLSLGCPLLKKKRFKSIVSDEYQSVLLKKFGQSPYTDFLL